MATVLPAERRGEGLGVLGVVCMLPAVGALPFGIWLSGTAGYSVVFVVAAVPATVAAALTYGLPRTARRRRALVGHLGRAAAPGPGGPDHDVRRHGRGLGGRGDLPGRRGCGPGVAVLALAAQALATTVTRWVTGRYADRHGCAHLLPPAVVLTAAGLATAAFSGSTPAVLGGMVALGIGFGVGAVVEHAHHAGSGGAGGVRHRQRGLEHRLRPRLGRRLDRGRGPGRRGGLRPAFVVTAIAVALVATKRLTRG